MKYILFLFLTIGSAFALETDNYLVWDRTLQSSEHIVDEYLVKEIEEVLVKLNQARESLSCDQVTSEIAKVFRSHLVHQNPIENFLVEHLSPDHIFPTSIDYISSSIYRNPFRFYLPKFGLAPNIMIDNIYFGTDKLSHFASTGYEYYLIVKTLRKKLDVASAEEKAILFGTADEKMVHGYWSSGVFSFADLEANYQGLKFYQRFCQSEKPYLVKSDSAWTLSIHPRISEFVNPLWDESFNHSYFLPKNWEKITPVLKSDYCSKATSLAVIGRMSKYTLRTRSNPSTRLIQKLQLAHQLPVPQSFAKLCLASYN